MCLLMKYLNINFQKYGLIENTGRFIGRSFNILQMFFSEEKTYSNNPKETR